MEPIFIFKRNYNFQNDLDSNMMSSKCMNYFYLFDAIEKLKWIKEGKEGFTLDQIIEELTDSQELLNSIMNKYDYSKLPKE